MTIKKKIRLALIVFGLLMLTSCQSKKKENESTTNKTSVKQEEEVDNIKVQGQDIETEKKVGGEMLTKDLNLVFVWQPSCPPCQAEGKALEMIYKDFKDVNIVGLGVAESAQDVKEAVEDWGMTFKNYYVGLADIEKISKSIKSTPTMLVLDKDGRELQAKIVGSSSSGGDIEALSKKLKERIQGIVDEQK